MNKKIIIIGGGGHAKVLYEILLLRKFSVAGYADVQSKGNMVLLNKSAKYLGTDDFILKRFNPKNVSLVNGIGSTKDMSVRKAIFEKFKSRGFSFATLTHPSAIISKSAIVDEGTQVMAGAVVQPCVSVGKNSIINTRASIDHDCLIHAHVHIAPGCVLSGGVVIGEGTHVGTGAVIIQGVHVGKNLLIRARSLTVRHVLEKKDAESSS